MNKPYLIPDSYPAAEHVSNNNSGYDYITFLTGMKTIDYIQHTQRQGYCYE
jgi:hypothetical protein